MAFALGLDFKVARTLVKLFNAQTLGLYTELEVELSTLLKRLFTGVGITFDVVKESIGEVFIAFNNILDYFKSEYLLFQLRLVSHEVLFLLGNLAGDHGSTTALFLAGQFPVLELLYA